MSSSLRLLLPAAALILGATGLSAQSVIISDNFSTYDGTTTGTTPMSGTGANYNFNNQTPANFNLAAVGIGGSQAIQLSSTTDNQITYKATAINLNSGVVTISFFFQKTEGRNNSVPEVGIVTSDTSYIGSSGVGIRVNTTGTGLANDVRWQTRNNNVSSDPSATFAMTTGAWYQFNLTVSKSATTNVFDLAGTIYEADSAGIVGSLFSSYSSTATNAGLYTDTSVFASIRAQGNGVGVIDNLVVSQGAAIPEPSTYAALAGLGVLGLAAARRRPASTQA